MYRDLFIRPVSIRRFKGAISACWIVLTVSLRPTCSSNLKPSDVTLSMNSQVEGDMKKMKGTYARFFSNR